MRNENGSKPVSLAKRQLGSKLTALNVPAASGSKYLLLSLKKGSHRVRKRFRPAPRETRATARINTTPQNPFDSTRISAVVVEPAAMPCVEIDPERRFAGGERRFRMCVWSSFDYWYARRGRAPSFLPVKDAGFFCFRVAECTEEALSAFYCHGKMEDRGISALWRIALFRVD